MQKCHIESNTHSGKKLSVLYFKHQARRTEMIQLSIAMIFK